MPTPAPEKNLELLVFTIICSWHGFTNSQSQLSNFQDFLTQLKKKILVCLFDVDYLFFIKESDFF